MLLCVALILAGSILHLGSISTRSLWLDEAAVANSVTQTNLGDALKKPCCYASSSFRNPAALFDWNFWLPGAYLTLDTLSLRNSIYLLFYLILMAKGIQQHRRWSLTIVIMSGIIIALFLGTYYFYTSITTTTSLTNYWKPYYVKFSFWNRFSYWHYYSPWPVLRIFKNQLIGIFLLR